MSQQYLCSPLAGVCVHAHRVAFTRLVKLPLELLHVGLPHPVVLLPVLVEHEPDGQGGDDAEDPDLLSVGEDEFEPLGGDVTGCSARPAHTGVHRPPAQIVIASGHNIHQGHQGLSGALQTYLSVAINSYC